MLSIICMYLVGHGMFGFGVYKVAPRIDNRTFKPDTSGILSLVLMICGLMICFLVGGLFREKFPITQFNLNLIRLSFIFVLGFNLFLWGGKIFS